ncbi:MAG: nucleoside 2-deoxyribosyltransferase [Alphaproteobacteria bacterium]|nr:nucleoside 2-deoxyribosyltransferase [Alphaproteobacteria bacterium]
MTRPLIYIAAPLFSDAEKSANEAMSSILERYCETFLPQRDGYLIPSLIERGMSVADAYSYVFKKDVEAIQRCDAVIINLDGRAVDEGAAFELGVGFAAGKLCVGYRTDVRVLLPWGQNPMITGPLQAVLGSPVELEGWVIAFASCCALGKARA